jgi:hypothetical protein
VQRNEHDERVTLCKLPKANLNGLTLVLSTPFIKGVGLAPGFRMAL